MVLPQGQRIPVEPIGALTAYFQNRFNLKCPTTDCIGDATVTSAAIAFNGLITLEAANSELFQFQGSANRQAVLECTFCPGVVGFYNLVSITAWAGGHYTCHIFLNGNWQYEKNNNIFFFSKINFFILNFHTRFYNDQAHSLHHVGKDATITGDLCFFAPEDNPTAVPATSTTMAPSATADTSSDCEVDEQLTAPPPAKVSVPSSPSAMDFSWQAPSSFTVTPKLFLSDGEVSTVWTYLDGVPATSHYHKIPISVYEHASDPNVLAFAHQRMLQVLQQVAGGLEWVGTFSTGDHYIAGQLEQHTLAPWRYKLTLYDSYSGVSSASAVHKHFTVAMEADQTVAGPIQVLPEGLGWQNKPGNERENSCGIYASWVAHRLTHGLPLEEPSLDTLALLRCISHHPTVKQLEDWVQHHHSSSLKQRLPELKKQLVVVWAKSK